MNASNEIQLQVDLQQSEPIDLQVRLACKAGELLALIGPSGSGKSTVLRTIAGLQNTTHQRISCGPVVWADSNTHIALSAQRRRIGLVFQHFALFPHKSALENVMLAIQHVPQSIRKQRAYDWLQRTNMTGLELRRPHALSGGQRQRVALARALAREPAALLLDEPFSAVDQLTRRILYRELAQLRSSLKIPIIMVTHDIHEVQQLADTVCLIHKGHTLQHGGVQQVINSPASKEIAKLLGHQNLIGASVEAHQNGCTVYKLGPDKNVRGPRVNLEIGAAVTLLIAPSSISLCDKDELGSTDNFLSGSIRDAVGLGDELSLRIHLDNVPKALRFRIPLHSTPSHGIQPDTLARIRIIPTGIHAIPDTE